MKVMLPATVQYLVIHHSLTVDGEKFSTDDIRRYHIQTNGWSDIGYHFVVEQIEDGEATVVGRPPVYQGAHAPGRNADSIGLCLVGDFDKYPPSTRIWRAGVKAAQWICGLWSIPTANVIGHREATAGRTCPGKLFDIEAFRRAVAGSVRVEE